MTTYELIVGRAELPFDQILQAEEAHPDKRLKLAVAAWLPELGGVFSEKQLRSAIATGRLLAMKAGRTLYVTRASPSRPAGDTSVIGRPMRQHVGASSTTSEPPSDT